MVDVSAKEPTRRVATARARVRCGRPVTELLAAGEIEKGDVLATARLAGIQAAKRTPELVPLCHPVALTDIEVRADVEVPGVVRILATATAVDRTGVEMEAMTAASVAALTVVDMVKSVARGVSIEEVVLLEKSGGRSGCWRREEPEG
jgi:cyclic pyranopterin phosphate synthase